MPNPYSDILAQFRTVVFTAEGVTPFIRAGNLVPDNRRPPKAVVPTNALKRASLQQGGELRIEPMPGGGLDTRATSSSAMGTMLVVVGVSTADIDPDTVLDIRWQIELAVHNAGETLGLPTLIRSVRVADVNLSNANVVLNRGREDVWSALLVYAVSFFKSRDSLT